MIFGNTTLAAGSLQKVITMNEKIEIRYNL